MSDLTTFVGAGCIHGRHQDPKAIEVLRAFTEDFKPDVRICGGDAFDFGPLRTNANKQDRAESMVLDVEAGMLFFDWFRPHVFLHGNHDFRLFDRAENDDGIIRDHCERVVQGLTTALDLMGCKQIPYTHYQAFMLDEIRFLHGEAFGMHAAAQASSLYRNRYIVQWHAHTRDYYKNKNGAEAWVSGCLLNLKIPYSQRRRNTARWVHAFPWGWTNKRTGAATINIATPDDDGVWYIAGKSYEP